MVNTTYALDLTAIAPANKVIDTYTRPSDGDWVIVPIAGAFYTQGLKVVNTYGNVILQPGVDYNCLTTKNVKPAILSSGKEICTIVVILNNNVKEISFSRQVVGDVYAAIGSDVSNLLSKTAIDALNSTGWSQVIGEPVQYTPEQHFHADPSDLYGFNPAISILGDISQAMSSGDSALFGMFYQHVDQIISDLETNYQTQINNLQTKLNNSLSTGRHTVNDIVIRTDNRNPGDADLLGYGTWTRIPDNTLLLFTSNDNLLGTSKKVGEGVDRQATYYAGWILTSL